jgi:pyruvate formate lyase activating enzyme
MSPPTRVLPQPDERATPTNPFLRPAMLQENAGGKVSCLACERRCLLVEGGQGWCRTRVNRDGILYTLAYGAVSSLAANPIEKKPLYHFYPGSRALTAGGWSCNFGCPWCQNWDISKTLPPAKGKLHTPEAFVLETVHRGGRGLEVRPGRRRGEGLGSLPAGAAARSAPPW